MQSTFSLFSLCLTSSREVGRETWRSGLCAKHSPTAHKLCVPLCATPTTELSPACVKLGGDMPQRLCRGPKAKISPEHSACPGRQLIPERVSFPGRPSIWAPGKVGPFGKSSGNSAVLRISLWSLVPLLSNQNFLNFLTPRPLHWVTFLCLLPLPTIVPTL